MRVQFSHRWNAYEYTRWSSIYFFYRIKEFFRFFDIYFSCKFCVILSFDYFDLTLISSLEMSSKKKKLCQTVINLLTYFKLSFSLGPIWEIFSIFFSLSLSQFIIISHCHDCCLKSKKNTRIKFIIQIFYINSCIIFSVLCYFVCMLRLHNFSFIIKFK